MRILINEHQAFQDDVIAAFKSGGYTENELIFCNSLEATRIFLLENLEKDKGHLDLIVTNDLQNAPGYANQLLATDLSYLKNTFSSSFSNANFRINSIPIMLYSGNENKSDFLKSKFDSIVTKNAYDNHGILIREVDKCIRDWRHKVLNDLECLELINNELVNFQFSKKYETYLMRYGINFESTYMNSTEAVSKEFIKTPRFLRYDWINLNLCTIERILYNFHSTYNNHLKYDRNNNERTVLHQFFLENPNILLKDVYNGFIYEPKLHEANPNKRQECDFILQTDYPSYLKTTFFEVKKEDVKLMAYKKSKRPRLHSDFTDNLTQIWDYKKYALNAVNSTELAHKVGYKTKNYNFQILAGHFEEKEELLETFNIKMDDHYNGIQAITFEEFEEEYENYFKKFGRLNVC